MSQVDAVRVMVVSERLLGELTAAALREDGRFTVAGPQRPDDSLRPALKGKRPEVVVFDVHGCPDSPVGDLVRLAREVLPGVTMLALVDSEQDDTLFDALDAGACGIVHQQQSALSMCEQVRQAAVQNVSLSPALARRVLARLRQLRAAPDTAPEDIVSPRELAVLCGVARGLTNEQIASESGVSVSTVKNQLYSACRKLGVTSRSHAIAEAIRTGIITAEGDPVRTAAE